MPRMTRAALKAQAQADDYPEIEQHLHAEKEQEPYATLIHEDLPTTHKIGDNNKPETDIHNEDDIAVRQALRDITDENYPKADLNVEVQSLSPIKQKDASEQEELEQETQKSTRKPRGKAKGRTKKKANTPTIVEPEQEQVAEEPELDETPLPVEEQQKSEHLEEASPERKELVPHLGQIETGEQAVETYEDLSEPGPAIEEDVEEDFSTQHSISKTPKFDPTIHTADVNEPRPIEDSFVHSITSRSPSKFGAPVTQEPETTKPNTNSLQAFTPLRRTSSTNFEESFEALDSLEDTIEQLTAGFSLISGKEMNSPDSPVKTNRRSVRIDATPSTPKVMPTRTPRTTSNRPQPILRTQDKENTPPVVKTPLRSKTPLKPQNATTKEATPLKARTPAARQSSPLKDGSLSVKKCRTPALKTISEMASKKSISATSTTGAKPASPTKLVRQSSAMATTTSKTQPAAKKPSSTLQRTASKRQTSVAPTGSKTESLSRKPTITEAAEKRAHQNSMSFSASPAKVQTNTHQRRVTSGGVLSTSKPGFIPIKSSKPPTTSTFSLPGEAIAEKLKAQKEAREEQKKPPRSTLAEQKAAKLKADREAREERVRLNQLKAKEAEEEKENKKPQRPVSMSVPTISKARAEAAERGRQASKEWAEKMLKKKTADVKPIATPVEAV